MDDDAPIAKMHELLLEALRSRELEIFKYLTILGPALAGFGWLLYQDNTLSLENPQKNLGVPFFMAVTIAVLLLLLLGALYSLTLGYNYRYITLQLAKLETRLDINSAILKGWPKSPEAFLERYRAFSLPWCTSPAVIKVFWYAFLAAIGAVTLTA